MVRPEGSGLNSQFNSLSAEELKNLFDTLEPAIFTGGSCAA